MSFGRWVAKVVVLGLICWAVLTYLFISLVSWAGVGAVVV